MPNSDNRQNSGSAVLKTLGTLGIGAMLGAAAAWYFNSEEEQRQREQPHVQRSGPRLVDRLPQPTSQQNNTEKDDEKDGTIKLCEICFVSFDELKECGVQIDSTPCGHVYCRQCILGALEIKHECPHCRSHVTPETLRRLYL